MAINYNTGGTETSGMAFNTGGTETSGMGVTYTCTSCGHEESRSEPDSGFLPWQLIADCPDCGREHAVFNHENYDKQDRARRTDHHGFDWLGDI